MARIKNPMNARHLEHNDHQDGSIARKGSVPKRTNDGPVPHHPGMTSRQKNAAGIGGMGHGTTTISGGEIISTSAAAQSLAHAYGSLPNTKHGKPVPPTPGMRSRNAPHSSDLGEAILRQAFSVASADDCAAHGRNPFDGSRK